MKWSEQAWLSIEPIYESILQMPFIQELTNGSLALEKFQYYLMQDSIYLEHFGRALAIVGARANNIPDMLSFFRFAETTIIVENALHESYFKDFGIVAKDSIQPACHHYTHFLRSNATMEAVEVAMAAVLPCFWIYKAVGDYIYQHQKAGDNPYQKWINTYAGEEFGIAVKSAISICDNNAAQTTVAIQEKMTEAFIMSARLEYDFWEAAYINRRWR
ncbi:thiaminase II [Emticicia agri]|uniref:Aminopyrimidine aminohydrolase n=1 Tax=Emticicia agri TaxID=2492393 RepID=A0A4Q5LTU4_9BACT|nr:thiaminase II [Emticicia agri]RYU93061.1 thiaminase II [Emticicia agri]